LAGAAVNACSASDTAEEDGNAASPAEPPASPCALVADRPSPRTVLEVVDRVNELPQPVTLPCFIESLARPLELNATESFLSAQPAVGLRSPRAFIFSDPLIMSIAFDGMGSPLLELGELRAGGERSLKAEIEFPVNGELSQAAPFERILFGESFTTCGVCHADEQAAPDVTFTQAFESRALRPVPIERVSLDSLRYERSSCDDEREPARCALLDAVFGAEPVVDRDFPPTLPTFYWACVPGPPVRKRRVTAP
jgi:hypothetical protein